MLKFLVLVLLATVSCELGLHFDYSTEYAPHYDNYEPRDYHFDYFISDPNTGDHKSQWEVKENGVVRGEYSLLEPDGTTRIVDYIADDHGFRAVVKKLGTAVHPQPLQTPEKILPTVRQTFLKLAHFGTYDRQVSNYANIFEITAQHLETIPAEIPVITNVHHDIQEQNVQPITYEIQQPLLYQHQKIYPGVIGFREINQHMLTHPVDMGYIDETKQVQPLGKAITEKIVPGLSVAPLLSLVGPSYHTTIEYHGLTGNPEADSCYTVDQPSVNYEYQSESSEKVRKLIAPPITKKHTDIKLQKFSKEQFIIYYPDNDM